MQRWRPSERLACSLHRKSFAALEDLCSNRLPQVKQAVAMQWIDQRQRELGARRLVMSWWCVVRELRNVAGKDHDSLYPFRVNDLESYFGVPDKCSFNSCWSSQIRRSDESANSQGHERILYVTCWRHLQRILIRNEDVGPRWVKDTVLNDFQP
jgi:hypothetical protein